MTLFCGIDPGYKGGIAVINHKGIATVRPMPVIVINKGKKGKRRRAYDHAEFARLFSKIGEKDCYACVEEQQAFPGQGVVSMFSAGCGFCMIKQCLHDFGISHEVVSFNPL